MNFMEWLTKEGFSDAEIGNILCYFRKLPDYAPRELKLAAKFILGETDHFQPKRRKKVCSKDKCRSDVSEINQRKSSDEKI